MAQLIDELGRLDDDSLTSILMQCLQNRPELAPDIMKVACPELTYAPSRALTDRRCSGMLKALNPETGYAQISCPELHAVFGSDVTVHRKQLGSFTEGTQVSFAVTLTEDNDPQAFDLLSVLGGCGGCSGVPSAPSDMNPMAAMAAMGGGMPSGGGGMGDMASMMAAMGGMSGNMGGGNMGGGMGGNMGGAMGSGMNDPNMAMMQQMMGGGMCGGDAGKGKGKKGDQTVLGEYFGVIKSYNPEKGFGFVSCDALKDHEGDVYLHAKHIGNFQVGAEVKFQAYLHQGRLQGRDLQDATGQIPPQQGGMQALPPPPSQSPTEELGNFIGTIKSFNVDKGFGFIDSPDLKAQGYAMDAFLDKDFLAGFKAGDMVSFAAFLSGSKLRARELKDASGGMNAMNTMGGCMPGMGPPGGMGGDMGFMGSKGDFMGKGPSDMDMMMKGGMMKGKGKDDGLFSIKGKGKDEDMGLKGCKKDMGKGNFQKGSKGKWMEAAQNDYNNDDWSNPMKRSRTDW